MRRRGRLRPRSGALTLKPDTRDGHFAILDENGDTVGAGVARASETVPGYVTLVVLECERTFGPCVRVPSDWLMELGTIDVRYGRAVRRA